MQLYSEPHTGRVSGGIFLVSGGNQLTKISAEREGFEPPLVLPKPVFKTGAINRSAISPVKERKNRTFIYLKEWTRHLLNKSAHLPFLLQCSA